MASKGIVCLLALLYLVQSSHQNSNEALAVSSQRSGQPESGEEEDRSEAHGSAHAQANARSLLQDPNYNGGGPICRYEEQVINRIVNGECLVCVCVMRRNTLTVEPVCGSCNNCQPQYPTLPPPPPTTQNPVTIYPPQLITTPAPPPPEFPKCDPLPPNVPFQNPLDPCQVCICLQSTDLYGNPQTPIIECQRNPECATPPPQPVDTVCSVYPINVWFKHPRKQCEICECTPEQQYNGQVRPVLVCLPDPACDVPATTLLPPTTPPLYPPIDLPTTWRPPPPPSPPRKSCYPFIPNVPFNHTWDPCQVCVCTEEYYENTVTIEIQCQARRDCCLEWYHILDPSVVPVPLIPGQIVQPGYPHVIRDSANAIAGAVASAGAGQTGSSASSSTNAGASSMFSPNGAGLLYPSGSQSQNTASAEAVANVNNNHLTNPSQPGLLPTKNLFQTNANSYADAQASANTQAGLLSLYGQASQSQSAANAGAVIYPDMEWYSKIWNDPFPIPVYQGQNPNGVGLLYPSGSQSQSAASAEAVANVINDQLSNLRQPGLLPTQNVFQTNANSYADADASANTQAGLLSLYGQGSQSQSSANAGVVANVNNNKLSNPGQSGLLPPQNLFQTNTNSYADALASGNTQAGLLSLYGKGSQSQSTANTGTVVNTLALKYANQGGLLPSHSNLNSLNVANNPQLQYSGYARPQMGQNVADSSVIGTANAGMLLSLYGPGSKSQSEANSEANANSFVSNLYKASKTAAQADAPLHQGQLGLPQSLSLTDADAIAASNANGASYPYGSVLSQISAEADASASANANNGLSPYTLLGSIYGSGPDLPQTNTQSQANAIAQANAQAQQNTMAQTNAQAQAQAVLAQLQGDAMHKAIVLPNLYTGRSNAQAQAVAQGQSNANAQANARALGGDSSQASAQAYVASKKSGDVEEEGLKES